MIYAEIRGRCGNQMFLYAISRKLEKMYGSGITFNFYTIREQSFKDKTWKDDLINFNVCNYEIVYYNKQLVLVYGNIIQKLIFFLYFLYCKLPCKSRPDFYKRQERVQPFLNYFGIYDMVHGYAKLGKTKFKNQFICGTYEDSRFFDDIRDDLIKEFTTKKILNEYNDELYSIIKKSESVCVSFRRGDFLNSANSGLRDICNAEYYEHAIQTMKELVPDAKFIFFSDDIEWVKENINYNIDSYYETGLDDIGEKMRLMSNCKHFVMSNSTFCWWAQYLSQNEHKIVVSPDHWFNMKGYKHQLIGKDWILIEC